LRALLRSFEPTVFPTYAAFNLIGDPDVPPGIPDGR